jgi:hypothetical protein
LLQVSQITQARGADADVLHTDGEEAEQDRDDEHDHYQFSTAEAEMLPVY